jgi:hypothetical protein
MDNSAIFKPACLNYNNTGHQHPLLKQKYKLKTIIFCRTPEQKF